MSSSNCGFLTFIQIFQEAGEVVWYSHLLKNFPQFFVIHTVKDFRVLSESDVVVFLEFCVFSISQQMLAIWSLVSSAYSKSTLYIWKFSVNVLLKPILKDFENYLASMWNECNCAIVWTFFGIALLWDWNENWHFPILWPLLSIANLLAYWVQYFHSIIF